LFLKFIFFFFFSFSFTQEPCFLILKIKWLKILEEEEVSGELVVVVKVEAEELVEDEEEDVEQTEKLQLGFRLPNWDASSRRSKSKDSKTSTCSPCP
jgi:hypothetical protein